MTIVFQGGGSLTLQALSTGLLSHGNEAVTATRNVTVTVAQ